MKYKVKYSKRAFLDLEKVRMEVLSASSSYAIADKYIDDLLDKIEEKSDQPKSGKPLYYDNIFTGYYIVIFKAYLAFYRVDDSAILVDRVLFGGSDYIKKLHLDIDE